MLTEKINRLKEVTKDLSREELIWTQGFLEGLMTVQSQSIQTSSSETNHISKSVANKKITILYGTETGNTKSLALKFVQKIKSTGQSCKLASLDQYKFDDLFKEENVLFIVSTHGEGEPPPTARKFFNFLQTSNNKLFNLNFAVIGLGDSAYPLFCKAGEDLDSLLFKLGATQIQNLLKCDVDYETDAFDWFEGVWDKLKSTQSLPAPALNTSSQKRKERKYYQGKITTSINLNGAGSNKETYHIEINCDDKVDYEPGDALGIIPENRKDIVQALIKLTKANSNQQVTNGKFTGTVEKLLSKNLNICHLSTNNLKQIAAITGHQIPDIRMDLIDILRIYPLQSTEQFVEIIKILSPIAPRLYSISSAPTAHDNEIHLTVSQNSFRVQEEVKFGLCSQFIGLLPEGEEIEFYIHKNNLFKLPDPDKDLIMVGPGSGIAAMRSFLYEREATGASGRNWLFFGDQHFTTDFLYQTEIQKWLETGVLTKLSVAFSRDQESKVYVQDKMNQVKPELLKWIENGACVYVSGSREPMSQDVESTLLRIIESEGKTEDQSKRYLEILKEENRYLLDVY